MHEELSSVPRAHIKNTRQRWPVHIILVFQKVEIGRKSPGTPWLASLAYLVSELQVKIQDRWLVSNDM